MVALLGAVIGALLAGVFGLIGALVASKREHVKWLREKRYEAYDHYLRLVDRTGTALASSQHDGVGLDLPSVAQMLAAVIDAKAPVLLLGPEPVAKAANQMAGLLSSVLGEEESDVTKFREVRERFIDAAREAVQQPQPLAARRQRRSGNAHPERSALDPLPADPENA